MGAMIDGKWEPNPLIVSDDKGRFVRQGSVIHNAISSDPTSQFPALADRYHLYVSYACPWACRTLMMRALKGLEDVISFSVVEPLMLDNGWEFGDKGSQTVDPLNHYDYLYQVYQTADPSYSGRITVPVLWDKQAKTIVNNESAEIIRLLNSEFDALATNTTDYYPTALQSQIDELNEFIYEKINNGVYRCGFATTQDAYEEAFDELFAALDEIEQRLTKQRYLLGEELTEADIRLFPTLIRFDPVYVGHFKCNRNRIADYPHLSKYVCDMYHLVGVSDTVNFEHIKYHYYASHRSINPTGIVPKGPELAYLKP